MNMTDFANPTVWRSSWRMLRCVEGGDVSNTAGAALDQHAGASD